MPLLPRRRTPKLVLAVSVVLVVVFGAVLVGASRGPATDGVGTRDLVIAGAPASAGADPVDLDATFYTPEATPAPAVLLAHGFGGSKDSVARQARSLAADGYVVLAWSARGFGDSTGEIGLNAPDGEVADASVLVDYLAGQPEVLSDGPDDPRVAVVGGSYGGALALSLAGTDERVDADVAAITWNDLGQALLPDRATTDPIDADTPAVGATGEDGVLKRSWAGIFFSAGASPEDGVCGRFTPAVCRGYLAAAESGTAPPGLLDLLRRNSPTTTNAGVTAPTLLLQGEQDTLFGLDQADANAREITAAGAPLTVEWFAGGHDAGGTTPETDERTRIFLDTHLRDAGEGTSPAFTYEVAGSVTTDGGRATRRVALETYPGLGGAAAETTDLRLTGDAQVASRPPGASPSAISTVPGLGSALGGLGGSGLANLATLDVPGQFASFSTGPLAERITVTGAARVSLTVTPLAGADDVVLFAKLYDVSPDGTRTLPGGGLAAFRLTGLDEGDDATVQVTLPGAVQAVEAGHSLELVVATTDQAYAVPLGPAAYRVELAEPTLSVPTVGGTAADASTVPLVPLIGIGVILALVGLAFVLVRVRRSHADTAEEGLSDTPLVVRELAKSYSDGFRAVDGVTFSVARGQVLGLLGPNGAGKTTTLRMLMGLIAPSAGEILVFGRRVSAGSPVLSRLGSFVEGSGFLPHLTGAANLRLYWNATGRPDDEAYMQEALAIAGLGAAVERKVRSYSQGMRQRLAIAQAMLGLPDLLVLDEPTNGLDPPQIRAMRDVLRNYAASGRTVLVSSHLLSEVEQTCSHVVVIHKGRVVAEGTVAEIVSADGRVVLTVDEPERAAELLRGLDGVGEVRVLDAVVDHRDGSVQADLDEVPAATAVRDLVTAGVAVSGVAPRNRLEDVFLSLVESDPDRNTTGTDIHPGTDATDDTEGPS